MLNYLTPLLSLRPKRSHAVPLRHSYKAALHWLLSYRLPGPAIPVTNIDPTPYPEVTGYIVPTLLECGEKDFALDLAKWLISVQRPDGGLTAPDGLDEPYLFDVGQVLRGLVAVAHELPDAEEPIRLAANWMLDSADGNGIIRPTPDCAWSRRYARDIDESIHLYVLPPLIAAGRLLGEQRYVDCAERTLDYFVHKPDLLQFNMLTHFYGYVLEALVDLDRPDLARLGLQPVMDAQDAKGAIPAIPGARWICSPGQAQMAVVGYKLGETVFADKAIGYLQRLQRPDGGFLGSYGAGAAYFPKSEPSWACKYFLDAYHWKLRTAPTAQAEPCRI